MFELKTKRPHNASHIENAIQGWSYNDITTCFQALGSSEQGLSTPEVLQRQKSYGYNRINYIASPSWFTQLLKSFLSPFNGILSIVILITLLTQFWVTTASMKDSETIFATNDLSNRLVHGGFAFPNTHHSSDSHPPYSFFSEYGRTTRFMVYGHYYGGRGLSSLFPPGSGFKYATHAHGLFCVAIGYSFRL